MKIKPVDIKIKDNWKYGEVAFLVDRKDFLNDVEKARKILGVVETIRYKELDSWLSQEINQRIKLYQRKIRQIKKIRNKEELENSGILSFPKASLDNTVEKLRKKYHKAENFTLAIRSAVLTRVVTDNEFSSFAYCRVLRQEDFVLELGMEPQIAIIISPDTKPEEVQQLFKKEVPKAINEYKNEVLKTKRVTPDTISNIKRDREWYWRKEMGQSYSQIHKYAIEDGEAITRDGIIKAIKQYKERLSMEL